MRRKGVSSKDLAVELADMPAGGERMTDKPAKASYRISDLQESERPRERLDLGGRGQAERTPSCWPSCCASACRARARCRSVSGCCTSSRGWPGIHRAPFEDLVAEHGIGEAKAAQIKAAIELGRRLQESPPEEHTTISNPAQAADLVKYDMQALEYEVLRVILLDTRNQVLDDQGDLPGLGEHRAGARGGRVQAGRAQQRDGADRGAQPPQRRPDAQPGRRGRDARADQGRRD